MDRDLASGGPKTPRVVAIAGAPGSGKSSLVRCLADLCRDSATLHFDDYQTLTREPPERILSLLEGGGGFAASALRIWRGSWCAYVRGRRPTSSSRCRLVGPIRRRLRRSISWCGLIPPPMWHLRGPSAHSSTRSSRARRPRGRGSHWCGWLATSTTICDSCVACWTIRCEPCAAMRTSSSTAPRISRRLLARRCGPLRIRAGDLAGCRIRVVAVLRRAKAGLSAGDPASFVESRMRAEFLGAAHRPGRLAMYYKCRRCGLEEPRGILPGVTCGLMLAMWAGLSNAIVIGTLVCLLPSSIGWWWLLIGPVAFGLSIFPGSFLLNLLAMSIEWCLISLFPCKGCGSHRFTFGATHGFGL